MIGFVNEASRPFREQKFENVSAGEVMKAASLTRGAIYAHSGSEEGLQAAALAYGKRISLGRMRRSNSKKRKGGFADRYLSSWHRDNPGDGCTMTTLPHEVTHLPPELKAAFEQRLQEIRIANGGDRKEAVFQAAVIIGVVVLAHTVQDSRFSDEILRSVQEELN